MRSNEFFSLQEVGLYKKAIEQKFRRFIPAARDWSFTPQHYIGHMKQMFPDYDVYAMESTENSSTDTESDNKTSPKKRRYSRHAQSLHEDQIGRELHENSEVKKIRETTPGQHNQQYGTTGSGDSDKINSLLGIGLQPTSGLHKFSSESQDLFKHIADSMKSIQHSVVNFENANQMKLESLQNELYRTQEALAESKAKNTELLAQIETSSSETSVELLNVKHVLAKLKDDHAKEIAALNKRHAEALFVHTNEKNNWHEQRQEFIKMENRNEAIMVAAKNAIEKMKGEYNTKVMEMEAKMEAIIKEKKHVEAQLKIESKIVNEARQ